MGVVYWTPVCTFIGVANLLVFLLMLVFPESIPWQKLAFSPGRPEWHQLLTSIFMHANWQHLTMNAFCLFAFGAFLEKKAGSFYFTVVYLLAGLGGCLLFYLLGPADKSLIGASGAIFGIICGMVFLEPKAFVITPGAPLPIPIFVFAALYIGNEIMMASSGTNDRLPSGGVIAHLAHVGGGIAGALAGRLIKAGGGGGPAAK